MIEIKTNGMHCNGCEMLVKDALEEEGALRVIADHVTGIIKLEGLERKRATEIIKNEGYEVL